MSILGLLGVVVGIVGAIILFNHAIDRYIYRRELESDWVPDNDPYLIARRIGRAMDQKKKQAERKILEENS